MPKGRPHAWWHRIQRARLSNEAILKVPFSAVSTKRLRRISCIVHNSTISVCSCIQNSEICPRYVVNKPFEGGGGAAHIRNAMPPSSKKKTKKRPSRVCTGHAVQQAQWRTDAGTDTFFHSLFAESQRANESGIGLLIVPHNMREVDEISKNKIYNNWQQCTPVTE